MDSRLDIAHGGGLHWRSCFRGQQVDVSATAANGWWPFISEFVGVVAVYVLLARLGQFVAVAPGNITPIYPAAGFAMACVLLRGRRVWIAIWLGQFFGNTWAFIDFDYAGVAVMTSIVGGVTSCGALLQAVTGAYLIKRCCGSGNPFTELPHLFSFGVIVAFTCMVSASTGVTGLLVSGIVAWQDYVSTLLTWYVGDLMGVVLWVPLIMTWPFLAGHIHKTHRVVETGVLLSLVLAFCLCVRYGYVPPQFVGSALLLLTLPFVLWAAFRLAQPGVAIVVNLIGISAAFLTIRGLGPFVVEDTTVALELLQMYLMVTMMAGLSLAIAIEQLRDTDSSFSKLRMAIDQASEAIFLVAPDASFEYANAQATTLLGYSRKALMSMAVYDIDPNFPADTWQDFWRDTLQRERLHFESVVCRKNRSEVPVEVSVNRQAVDDTELACAIVKDISERKRAEDSASGLKQILDSTSAVIYQKDLEGRYEFANNRWAQLFNIDPCDIKGKTDFDLFPREVAEAFHRNDRRVIDNRQSLRIQEVAPHADGPHTYISVKVPVCDGKGQISGVAGISTDISEQLAAKEELKNSERLADIGRMITGLAHECRNALQRSQACLSMLVREIAGQPMALDYANRVQQAQDHLQHVFEELRSYALPLHLERRPCNLRVLIDEAWEEVTSVLAAPNVQLQVTESDTDLTCDVDAFRIRQVFRNIFENAISVSPAFGSVTVDSCHVDRATGTGLRTTVRDAGPGFTPEQRSQALKPFYTTKVTGTGLGLTITQRIVESHGGEIEIAGDSVTGGIVTVTLPQRRE